MKCGECGEEGKILIVHPDGSAYCLKCLINKAKATDNDWVKVSGLISLWLEDLGHKITPDMLDC